MCPACLNPKCRCNKRTKRALLRLRTEAKRKTTQSYSTPLPVNKTSKPRCNCVANNHEMFPYNLPLGFSIWDNPSGEPCIINRCRYMAVVEHIVKVDLGYANVSSIRRLCAIHAVHWVRLTCPKEVESAYFRKSKLTLAQTSTMSQTRQHK